MSEERSLSFAITGEFVTRTAREWLWLEGKPWSVVEEFLLSCMCGTDKSREELSELAFKVVSGRAKFIGNTADETYAMVDDNQDLVGDYIGRWNRKVKKLEKECREIEDKYYALTNYLIDSGRGYLLSDAGVGEDEDEDPVASAMLNSYMKQDAIEREGHTDNYGWLAPNGEFYPVEWGEHQGWAHHKVIELGWIGEDTETWIDNEGNTHCVWTGEEGDILVDRGWVLLHNPAKGVAKVTANSARPLTKAQKDFLYGYYADRGLMREAATYMEDMT